MFPTRLLTAVAAGSAVLAAGSALASSHREAPGITNYPAADNTDTYFFVSPNDPDAVTVVGCWWPAEEPSGGPNWFHFADDVDYVFHFDNDGDALPDVSYVFRFRTTFMNPNTFLYATGEISSLSDPDWNYRQTYRAVRVDHGVGQEVLVDGGIVPPVNIGPRTTPSYEALAGAATQSLEDGTTLFAGQRDDPFFVDLGAVFDLLGFRAIPGNVGQGVDGLGGFNCQAIVMEIPIARLTRDGSNPADPSDAAAVIGVWATSVQRPGGSTKTSEEAASALGREGRQVSRLGMPLVNEVVVPIGQKDVWNGSQPSDDAQFLGYVTDPELANLFEAIYGITRPAPPRCDLAAAFLTGVPGLNQPPNVVPAEEMRLNVAIKPDDVPDSRLGVLGGDLDGFPNGRRLTDDIVDIEERVVAGVLYPLFCDDTFVPHPLAGQLGDGIDGNDLPFLTVFPYLATPHQGFDHDHHRMEPPHPPQFAAPPLRIGTVSTAGKSSTPVGAGEGSEGARFELGTASPNPASGPSEIRFQVPRESQVTLRVYDVIGRLVRTLAEGVVPAGAHTASWDGRDESGSRVAAGVYLYRLDSPGVDVSRKMTVIR
jgi:hypothetical protein